MSDVANLLSALRAASITAEVALDLDGPAEALTDERIAEVRRLKPDLLRMLVNGFPVQTGAGTTPAHPQLVAEVNDAFADGSGGELTVVSVEATRGRGGRTRREIRMRAAELIRDARRQEGPGRGGKAVAMRDAWRERVAVCTIEGGLGVQEAERVALGEIELWDSLLGKYRV